MLQPKILHLNFISKATNLTNILHVIRLKLVIVMVVSHHNKTSGFGRKSSLINQIQQFALIVN